jgi:hypothetical protein
MFNLHLIIQPLVIFLIASPFKAATSKLPLPSSSCHSHSHRHGSIMASKLFLGTRRNATQRNAIRFPLLLLQEPKAKQSAHSGCLSSERLYPYCCLHVVVATYIDRSN